MGPHHGKRCLPEAGINSRNDLGRARLEIPTVRTGRTSIECVGTVFWQRSTHSIEIGGVNGIGQCFILHQTEIFLDTVFCHKIR